jgi:hypothetical protein
MNEIKSKIRDLFDKTDAEYNYYSNSGIYYGTYSKDNTKYIEIVDKTNELNCSLNMKDNNFTIARIIQNDIYFEGDYNICNPIVIKEIMETIIKTTLNIESEEINISKTLKRINHDMSDINYTIAWNKINNITNEFTECQIVNYNKLSKTLESLIDDINLNKKIIPYWVK